MHNSLAKKLTVSSALLISLAFPQEGNAQIEKSISWGYDSQGRLSYETISGGGTTQYLNYSDHGIAKNVKYKSEVIVRDMSFNLDGTASTIGYSSNAQTQASYSYSAFSSPLDSQLDINNVRTFEEKTMRYDSRGNLKSLVKYYDGSNINYAYDYDAMGKLKKFSINNSSVNYNYDDKGNLTGKNGLSAINGKLQVSALPTQSYNIKNQNTHWQYDNDGRVIEDHEFSYQYNHAGRLTLISSKSTGQWVSHFLYDASGNRVRKMTPENVTYYYRNAKGDIVSEEKFDLESGELIEKQRHIAHNGMNVASVNSNSENEPVVNYQYSGRLGSQSVRWNAQQVLTQDYAPYGEQMDSDNIHSGSYGFTGHEDDTETESTYMKARHYKTNYGRMNRPDPARDFDIHNPSSFNLYAYVGNNPVNAWDPTGLLASPAARARQSYCSSGGVCPDISQDKEESIEDLSIEELYDYADYYIEELLAEAAASELNNNIQSGIVTIQNMGFNLGAPGEGYHFVENYSLATDIPEGSKFLPITLDEIISLHGNRIGQMSFTVQGNSLLSADDAVTGFNAMAPTWGTTSSATFVNICHAATGCAQQIGDIRSGQVDRAVGMVAATAEVFQGLVPGLPAGRGSFVSLVGASPKIRDNYNKVKALLENTQ